MTLPAAQTPVPVGVHGTVGVKGCHAKTGNVQFDFGEDGPHAQQTVAVFNVKDPTHTRVIDVNGVVPTPRHADTFKP